MEIDDDKKLWSLFESLNNRLSSIDGKLDKIVMIEERQKHISETLDKYGTRIDGCELRIRDAELQLANSGDKSHIESVVRMMQEQITSIQQTVVTVQNNVGSNTSDHKATNAVLKIVVGILTALLIYKLNKG